MYQTHSDFVIVEWSNKGLRKIHFRVILISKYSCTDEQKLGTNRPHLSVRRTMIVGRTVWCNVPYVLIIVLFVISCVSAIMLFVFSACCLHCYYAPMPLIVPLVSKLFVFKVCCSCFCLCSEYASAIKLFVFRACCLCFCFCYRTVFIQSLLLVSLMCRLF